jgi:hypothetical protein
VEDHDHDQDQVQEQGVFCSGKAIIEWWVGFQKKKKKKKVYIFLTGFLKSFWAFCEQIGKFWVHFML